MSSSDDVVETMPPGGAAETLLRPILAGATRRPMVGDLRETPARFLRALVEMTKGEKEDPRRHLRTVFDGGGYDEVVALRRVPFASLCEHHVLPFQGTIGMAYLPNKRVVGISKLARLAEGYARRLQIQERLTAQIGTALVEELHPRGVAVLVQASHSCMTVRGIQKAGAVMTTSFVSGLFKANVAAREEALSMLREGA